jgi:hypothetical protein
MTWRQEILERRDWSFKKYWWTLWELLDHGWCTCTMFPSTNFFEGNGLSRLIYLCSYKHVIICPLNKLSHIMTYCMKSYTMNTFLLWHISWQTKFLWHISCHVLCPLRRCFRRARETADSCKPRARLALHPVPIFRSSSFRAWFDQCRVRAVHISRIRHGKEPVSICICPCLCMRLNLPNRVYFCIHKMYSDPAYLQLCLHECFSCLCFLGTHIGIHIHAETAWVNCQSVGQIQQIMTMQNKWPCDHSREGVRIYIHTYIRTHTYAQIHMHTCRTLTMHSQ